MMAAPSRHATPTAKLAQRPSQADSAETTATPWSLAGYLRNAIGADDELPRLSFVGKAVVTAFAVARQDDSRPVSTRKLVDLTGLSADLIDAVVPDLIEAGMLQEARNGYLPVMPLVSVEQAKSLAATAAALTVECPFCGAVEGDNCATARGLPTSPHAPRVQLAPAAIKLVEVAA